MTSERRREVVESVESLSRPNMSFYVLVALSTTIAAYGLLSNSTAVVIGAMLVAPLMGPIFGIALSLTIGDRQLLSRAAVSELAGIALAVALSLMIGLVPLRLGFGSEIVARTQPTLYDVIIAVASGLAGAYALMDERVSPALPGVAIATALVPPLATCGLCLATGRWEWATGALLLFFANFLAIQIAAAFVFVAFGMLEVDTLRIDAIAPFVRRFALSAALIVVVSVYMAHTLVTMVYESRLSRAIERTLTESIRSTAGAQLANLSVVPRGGEHSVIATVLTPQEITAQQVRQIEQRLRREVRPDIRLVIRSLVSKDYDGAGLVYLSDDSREKRAEVDRQTRFLTQASQALQVQLAEIPGGRLVDLYRNADSGSDDLTAVVQVPSSVDPAQVSAMESAVRRATQSNVRLIVRSVLTVTADSQQFLYTAQNEQRPIAGLALRFYRRLMQAVANQVSARTPGASVTDLRYDEKGRRLVVFASVRAPRALDPADVAQVQQVLRRYVHPGTELVVRSVVGADADARTYLKDFDETSLQLQP